MSAPEKIWSINNKMTSSNDMSAYGPQWVEYTRTDLSQAAVAAALEAAAQIVDAVTEALGARLCCDGHMCGCQGADVGEYILHHIRDLITPSQHDALAAHVAAEVAKARAEDAAWLPVEDAPQDGTAVITIKSNGDVARGAWYQNPFGDENTFIDRASGKWWTAVGWLPMPKALAARPDPQPAAEHEYPDPLIAEDRYEDDQPAADTRVVPLDRLQAWLDCLVSSEIKAEIRAIIGNAQSDKIVEAAQDKTAAELVIDAYDAANPFRQADMHPALCHCNRCAIDWLRALAGKGE